MVNGWKGASRNGLSGPPLHTFQQIVQISQIETILLLYVILFHGLSAIETKRQISDFRVENVQKTQEHDIKSIPSM